jgi:hypothetical protein
MTPRINGGIKSVRRGVKGDLATSFNEAGDIIEHNRLRCFGGQKTNAQHNSS